MTLPPCRCSVLLSAVPLLKNPVPMFPCLSPELQQLLVRLGVLHAGHDVAVRRGGGGRGGGECGFQQCPCGTECEHLGCGPGAVSAMQRYGVRTGVQDHTHVAWGGGGQGHLSAQDVAGEAQGAAECHAALRARRHAPRHLPAELIQLGGVGGGGSGCGGHSDWLLGCVQHLHAVLEVHRRVAGPQ